MWLPVSIYNGERKCDLQFQFMEKLWAATRRFPKEF